VGAELLHLLIAASKLRTPEGAVVQGLRFEAQAMAKGRDFKRMGSVFINEAVPRILLRDADRSSLVREGGLECRSMCHGFLRATKEAALSPPTTSRCFTGVQAVRLGQQNSRRCMAAVLSSRTATLF